MISLVYRAVNAVARHVRSGECEKGRELRLILLARRHCELAMTEMPKTRCMAVNFDVIRWVT